MTDIKAVVKALKEATQKLSARIDVGLIEIPPDPKMGDYAFPCFTIAKEMKKNPADIAKELAERIKPGKYIDKVEAKGPYLNFFVNSEKFAEQSLTEISEPAKSDKIVMIEFSSPNTNKPLHLGHLRNISLGESVSRLREYLGNNVVRSCLVNDRGIHICKSMLMYQKKGRNMEPNKKSDHYVGDFYVMFNEEVKNYPTLELEAQEMLRKWEAGDREVISLWKKMNKWAIDGFNETYKQLKIKFDKFYYESDIYDKGKDLVRPFINKGVYTELDGGGVGTATLGHKYGIPEKIIVRIDGTSLYITQDVYLAKLKFDEYNLDYSVYVVGSEQNLHFQQLFAILKEYGYRFADKCSHLSYGMVNLPSGRMKSREGTVVDADDIISELKSLASKEIKKRHKLSQKEETSRAKKIGLAALRFYLLKMDPIKDMIFNPEESISFEGETGPYIQYTYARASSILRKYGRKVSPKVDFSVFNEAEMIIVKKLAKFSSVVTYSAESYKPSILCRYLLDLSQVFNEYYHSTPVIKTDEELMRARLLLVTRTREVIKSGLNLLGIDVLEEM